MPLTPVAVGQAATASQYNALVTAIQDESSGHAHTGETDGGAPVSHSDLADGAIAALVDSHSHAEIDDHVDGAQGQHGLNANMYVAGAGGSQLVFQAGNATTDATVALAVGFYDQAKTITFTTPFASVLGVIVTPRETEAAKVGVDTVSTTGFRARIGFTDEAKGKFAVGTAFYWLAWGTV